MKQTVIIDTGSRLTAFPCIGCTDCGNHMDKYFDFKSSTTSRVVKCDEGIQCSVCDKNVCGYSQSYAEGSSISGILVEDYILFGDDFPHAHRELGVFGCHRRETYLFRTQKADGIMGLGYAKSIPTLIDLLYKSHNINTDLFSICLASNDGFMTIGGYNISTHISEIIWTNTYDKTFYAIKFKGLSVGDIDTGLQESDFPKNHVTGTIIDSGTTFTYLSKNVYSIMFKYIDKYCENSRKCLGSKVIINYEPNKCYDYNSENFTKEEFFDSFPILRFFIDDVYVEWMPERYLFAWPETKNSYCIGMYSNEASGNVLGGNFMRGMDVIFDRSEKKVGFAKSLCDPSFIHPNYTSQDYDDTNYYGSLNLNYKIVTLAFLLSLISIASLLLLIYLRFRKKRSSIIQFSHSNSEEI
ncbi:hypothetical protein SteCoe_2543 [Stentor coeruleus]|uniref:Peptidase A1 domain-containing protein n=1 Tax=Stentor coeruleus TaxID=5963 RepID=A0A1R2CZD3_9CILI|nr:hypothetical protein SteCoe_9084 [Stentor coeruleus]OMJ94341.1 hypothetical protein SteCoe_2543 [Stentor coeruleus]